MNIQQAKYHLKRIHTILDLQDKDLSPLDRDILLEDLRKLYEIILYTSQSGTQSVSPTGQTPEPVESPDKESIIKSRREEIPVSEPVKTHTSLSEERYSHEGRPSEETSPIPAESRSEEERKVEKPPHREIASSALSTEQSYKEETIKEDDEDNTYMQPSSKPGSYPTTDTRPSKDNGQHGETAVIEEKEEVSQYPELFDFKSTEDLSEKLGNSKVEHLNRILAINDKILYINHLYGGEAIPFQESLRKFESFYTYEEAKSYAARELVEQYHWTDKDKISTVQQFMRQVKRLYS